MPATASVVIASPQAICKDCYAPAPNIDLTLRSNGEEAVMVMNPLGQFFRCGIDAPTAAPVVSAGGGGTHPPAMYWAYKYVYVVKLAFPLVENAVTGGASPAPRSNPSPSAPADPPAGTVTRIVALTTTQQTGVTHIWIYRSLYFPTQAEANNAAEGNNVFWIGEVANNPNVATVSFNDSGALAGNEQVEGDNFPAPQFKYCVYNDPFFYGIGNDILALEVAVTASGVMTIVTPSQTARWFDGRNGQVVHLAGVTTGGFDNLGGFYFKYVNASTAQLYQDIALTSPAPVNPVGTTIATIKGQSTTLYRSKPRNPLAWGFTDLIGEVQAPQPYAFKVGGGRATALGVIPNLSVLKIDTEAPNKCYSLNLKNAGTANFEASLRSLPDNYCVSLHHTQFTASTKKGPNILWGLDTKAFAIVECDGSSQQPISDAVCKTLRNLATADSDRVQFHANYCPRLELNCIFVRTRGANNYVNTCLFLHGPTNKWGQVDVFDVLCSTQILHPETREIQLIVGTQDGLIGEFGATDTYANWCQPGLQGPPDLFAAGVGADQMAIREAPVYGPYVNLDLGVIKGNWLTYLQADLAAVNKTDKQTIRGFFFAHISNIEKLVDANGTYWLLTFDKYLNEDRTLAPIARPKDSRWWYIGLTPCAMGRFFDVGKPFDSKKLEEFLCTFAAREELGLYIPPSVQYGQSYVFYPASRYIYYRKLDAPQATFTDPATMIDWQVYSPFSMRSAFTVEVGARIGVMLRVNTFVPFQLMNYQLNLTAQDGNQR